MTTETSNAKEPRDDLNNVMIAAPCNIGWDNMVGNDRVRLCAGCNKNVYNTSRMTKSEIRELMSRSGKLPCLRIYRRADGTMITEDCPVGLRRVRDAWKRGAKVAASIWTCLISITGASAQNALTGKSLKTSQNVAESTQLPNNKESAESKSSKFDSPTTTTATTHEIAIGPDFRSVDLFQQAMQAAADGQTQQADKLFRESIDTLKLRHNDSAFEAKIYKTYADFLRDNNRENEANSVMQEGEEARKKRQNQIELIWGSPPDSLPTNKNTQSVENKSPQAFGHEALNGSPVEPSILDKRYYSPGRAKRAPKTSPTSPEGKPIPDNE